jgi:hypothetical protein
MKLFEFFNQPHKISEVEKSKLPELNEDEVFYNILDNDRLHKKYFFDLSKKIKKCEPDRVIEVMMPMVSEGCRDYYQENKLTTKMEKCFPKDMREQLCQRLYDHYCENYNLKK